MNTRPRHRSTRPADIPVHINPTGMDFEKRRLFIAAKSIVANMIADGALDYGLSFYGEVTTYTDTTHFKVAGLANKGAGAFKTAGGSPYEVYVFQADGAAPEGQLTPVVAYTSSDGTFQHAAFSGGNLAVGDIVLVIHPILAALGVKGTAAATGAVTTTDYLMAYVKQLVTGLILVLADTGELQTDWVNNGRLDNLIDAIKAKTDNLPSDPADQSLLKAEIDANETKIDALENLSAANVATELETYDAVKRSEATTDKNAIIAEIDTNEGKIDTLVTRVTAAVALASVLGALNDATGSGAVSDAKTAMTYLKQLVTAVILVLADTGELQTDWANGGRLDNLLDAIPTTAMRGTDNAATEAKQDTIDGIVDNILIDTAVIGALGAGLTNIPWNSSWDAQVESEAKDALDAYDPSTKTEQDTMRDTLIGLIVAFGG